jgi:hypothetical protein
LEKTCARGDDATGEFAIEGGGSGVYVCTSLMILKSAHRGAYARACEHSLPSTIWRIAMSVYVYTTVYWYAAHLDLGEDVRALVLVQAREVVVPVHREVLRRVHAAAPHRQVLRPRNSVQMHMTIRMIEFES